jgi:hypothetical protein
MALVSAMAWPNSCSHSVLSRANSSNTSTNRMRMSPVVAAEPAILGLSGKGFVPAAHQVSRASCGVP